MLDRRLRILRSHQAQTTRRAADTRAAFVTASHDAEAASLRAALSQGEAGLQPPSEPGSATVDVEWAALMGARFPSQGHLHLPDATGPARVVSSASVEIATETYREALTAAVAYAVAEAAARVVEAEIDTTGLRLRAIEDRWIPRLAKSRSALELALAEDERGEAVRMRWAVNAQLHETMEGET